MFSRACPILTFTLHFLATPIVLYIVVISVARESGKREGREGNFVSFSLCTHKTSEENL